MDPRGILMLCRRAFFLWTCIFASLPEELVRKGSVEKLNTNFSVNNHNFINGAEEEVQRSRENMKRMRLGKELCFKRWWWKETWNVTSLENI